jgi:hypothetical protein
LQIDILERNPDGDADAYTDEDIAHMRKVTSYCKRHLAQEEASLNDKSDEEAEKTKSYRSLKCVFLLFPFRDRGADSVARTGTGATMR